MNLLIALVVLYFVASLCTSSLILTSDTLAKWSSELKGAGYRLLLVFIAPWVLLIQTFEGEFMVTLQGILRAFWAGHSVER